MSTASFRFLGGLDAFLAPAQRDKSFQYDCARAATLKNAIEALGVPHTEIGSVTVNGEPATLQRIVRENDVIEVHPPAVEKIGSVPIFLADAHLGGLARFLRMLGYDTLHRNAFDDAEIRRLAEAQGRIVLTRDRELLKCREIRLGCYVRALKPEKQLAEVAARYGLAAHARPFTLCLHCNLPLETAKKREVADRVPPAVLALHDGYTRCAGCGRVYWPGSHYERMREALKPIVSPT